MVSRRDYQSENKYNQNRPLNGASYIELPEFIKKKHAVVNIECGGNQYFAHSVMAGLYPAKNGSSSQNKLHNYPHWKNKGLGLKLREEDFPISYADVPQFERDNDISINVYEVDEQEETIYGSDRTTKKRTGYVNLLLLEDEDGAHYCTIKHLSRLISSGINKDMHKGYVCETCFHSFSSEKKLNRHSLDCKTANECKIVLPRPEEAENNPYSIPRVNMKELGKMKEAYGGELILEFVGIRPKAYAMIKENE
ncbi:hypothetical protein QAD02_003088 [Eretmocerus hayati]|uniref:Uncharacterized protein n=1 Tax=Eretmocerus hayati TaxID=131215 RepID=A0ACC2NKP0_9HYME|nr:hypothetical protein QAD02_003088 [Eretmocerus hayati]